MPRNLPPLNALRAFECAGRHGSFSAAAQEMNVSHAAVSRHVRGLEKRLGVQLFRTVARGVELTEEGRSYLNELTPALDQIAQATDMLQKQDAGVVSVSCEPTFALKWLMPRLGDFYKHYPEIAVSLQASPLLADLERYERDLAIRYCANVAPQLTSDRISAFKVYPYGVPDFARATTPLEILDQRLLHEDNGVLWCRWFTQAGHPEVSLPPSNPLSTVLAIEGALSGQGIVLVSPELVVDDVRAGRLIRLSDIGLDYGAYHLVYLKEVVRRRAVAAFRDWFLSATRALRDSELNAGA